MNKLRFAFFFSLIAVLVAALPALAHAAGPVSGELGLQEAATPVAERLHDFYGFLFYIIAGIVAFVLGLLLYVMIRFNAKANPVPSTTTHNVLLEIVWTVVPVLILVLIGVKSIPLLYYMDRTTKPEMTLKVTGYQWYWGYEYPDNGGINFMANIVKPGDIDTQKGQIPLLSTDHPVVLPVDTNIQVLVTGSDVIHSFSVPSFGVKLDAVPGRMNETWVRITKPGYYYGQCDQLCGAGHGYMPIEVMAVSKEDFAAWVKKQTGKDVDADGKVVPAAAVKSDEPAKASSVKE